jgi:hypothetical protein
MTARRKGSLHLGHGPKFNERSVGFRKADIETGDLASVIWMGFIPGEGQRRDLWKSRLTSFDPSLLDCLTPLLGFVLDELAIVSGGERKLRRAKVSKLRFNFRFD